MSLIYSVLDNFIYDYTDKCLATQETFFTWNFLFLKIKWALETQICDTSHKNKTSLLLLNAVLHVTFTDG